MPNHRRHGRPSFGCPFGNFHGRWGDRSPVKRFAVVSLFVVLVTSGCSSAAESSPSSTPEPIADSVQLTPTITPTSTSSTTTLPPTTAPGPVLITCNTDDPEPVVHVAPLGSEVVVTATSSIEREFHLHGYDLELTGLEVTFRFTATLPGEHELTEHPDHSTVCIISS